MCGTHHNTVICFVHRIFFLSTLFHHHHRHVIDIFSLWGRTKPSLCYRCGKSISYAKNLGQFHFGMQKSIWKNILNSSLINVMIPSRNVMPLMQKINSHYIAHILWLGTNVTSFYSFYRYERNEWHKPPSKNLLFRARESWKRPAIFIAQLLSVLIFTLQRK